MPADHDFVISGQSCNPYHRNVDRKFLEDQLVREAWARALAIQLSSCNDIVLWERATFVSDELFARMTSRKPGDGFGRVELRGQEILIHPGDTLPTLAYFDVAGLPSPLRLHLKIGALDEAGQRVPEAGNVNVEVQLDKSVVFKAFVDRRSPSDRPIDVTGARELMIKVDNANGRAWWDWFLLSATAQR